MTKNNADSQEKSGFQPPATGDAGRKSNQVRVGGHVSISGGLDKAADRAADIGGNCMQIFAGSPRMWGQKSLDKYQPQKMWDKQKKLDIAPVVIHAKYLINLASDKSELVNKSIQALTYDLKFDNLIQGGGVVVHTGSYQDRGWEQVKEQVADAIVQILENTPDDSRLLLENAAEHHGKIGGDLAQIKWLLRTVDSARLGWCFDTCHGFAAGYALSPDSKLLSKDAALETKSRSKSQSGSSESGSNSSTSSDQSSLEKFQPTDFFSAVSELELESSLACVHVNDSAKGFKSGVDRHANIAEGEIPQQDLEYFLQQPLIKSVPIITEVPGIDGDGPDEENINRLKNLLKI